MFDQNLFEILGGNSFSGLTPTRADLPQPQEKVAPLKDDREFASVLNDIERHHRALGGLVEGSDEITKMYAYTGLLVRLHKLSKREDGAGSEELRKEILDTLKSLNAAARALERDVYARLGDKVSTRIPLLDVKKALALVESWGVAPPPPPQLPAKSIVPSPSVTDNSPGVILVPKAESGPSLTVPVLTSVSSLEGFSEYRKEMEDLRTAFSRAVRGNCGKEELASFEAALKRLDTLSGLSCTGTSASENRDAVLAALELVRKTGDACRNALIAGANSGNPFQARISISRNKDQVVTFQVPVERANDVVFDFEGDQMLSLLKKSGDFPTLVYRFRQFETSMQGPGSTFKATRTLDPSGRFYTFNVTMDFYADYSRAKLLISAPNASGTGTDTLVFTRRSGIKVAPPVTIILPESNARTLATLRTSLLLIGEGSQADSDGPVTRSPASSQVFVLKDRSGSPALSIDSRNASPETLTTLRQATDAGYEIDFIGQGTFRVFRRMTTFDGKPVRVQVGEDIWAMSGSRQEVALGNGRVSSDPASVYAALIARSLREHLDCPPVLIERSSIPIDCSTSPDLAHLLRTRPDLRVRYSGHQKFGSENIISYEVVRKDDGGTESVYTKVSLSSYSDDWGRERDSLILAAIQEKDRHNSTLASIRIEGPAVPGGIPIYQQLSPKTFRLLSLLEQKGRVVTCTNVDKTWITFTITDRASKKELGSVNIDITRFSDADRRDQATVKMIESLLRYVDRSNDPETNERHGDVAARLRSRENRADYVLSIVEAASKLDEISLLQGLERWHSLALAKHLSRLPEEARSLTTAELESVATPLLHTLQRLELYEPGYLKRLADQSPETLNAFVLSMAKRIHDERKTIADNVVMDKDTRIVSLFHTDKMFGPEGLLNLALRVGIPVEDIMSFKNPSVIQGGRTPNLRFLTQVEELSANADSKVFFFVSAHGIPHTIQTSDKVSENIDVKTLAASLLKEQLADVRAGRRTTIDLSKKTLLLNTCYSYNIAQMLYRELHQQSAGYTLIPPTIITSAQRGMLGWGNRDTTATPMMDELLKAVPNGTRAITVGHLLSVDKTNAARFDRMLKNNAYLTYRPLGLPLLFYTEDHAIFHRTMDLGTLLDELERDTRRLVPGFRAPDRKSRSGPNIPNELSFNQLNREYRQGLSSA